MQVQSLDIDISNWVDRASKISIDDLRKPMDGELFKFYDLFVSTNISNFIQTNISDKGKINVWVKNIIVVE